MATRVLVGIEAEGGNLPQRLVVAEAHPPNAMAKSRLLGVLLFLFGNLTADIFHVDFTYRLDQLVE